ncbi:MAG: hypothetical protein ABFD91_18980 [Anaerohalosphaeraceae bacterium]
MVKTFIDFIDYNRFAVMAVILCMVVWIFAIGCSPVVLSPVNPEKAVNAAELETDYQVWLKDNEAMQIKFEAAGNDLKQQAENQAKFQQVLVSLATGQVANFGAFAELLMGTGLIGVIGDNIRKNGVIAGLKRNKAAA